MEVERKANVAEEVRNLEAAARLEKEQKELHRKQEDERLRKESEALELQRSKLPISPQYHILKVTTVRIQT